MDLLTPPLTPCTPATSHTNSSQHNIAMSHCHTKTQDGLLSDPDTFALPPPVSHSAPSSSPAPHPKSTWEWRKDMTSEERIERRKWISEGRGKSGLKIVIVTENFFPKVDGVTRTLGLLLEHLEREGHQCMLLGPGSGLDSYAGHPLVGTAGIPLVIYPGLKLNFLRPKFLTTIKEFQPDVVHFVDPIWLGAQTLMAMELGWAGEDWVTEQGPALGAGINGAIVASYHTNLATYATLFGMPRLEPIMWRFQQWLYAKTVLTLCPSPSTRAILESHSWDQVRIWSRGIDLSLFGPRVRSKALRASWGVGEAPSGDDDRVRTTASNSRVYQMEEVGVKGSAQMKEKLEAIGIHYQGRKASLPLTPPQSPEVFAEEGDTSVPSIDEVLQHGDESSSDDEHTIDLDGLPKRVVILFLGRISWEKNIHLLISAYAYLLDMLPKGSLPPKLVFLGDGPARSELEGICNDKGYDAVFMGQKVGKDVADCFASADVFGFPSFTETFGQVVLEALASGLPVIGLDAEGTRDLVEDGKTGLLLRLPAGTTNWPQAVKDHKSATFDAAAREYAGLLAKVVLNHKLRKEMGQRGSTVGIKGYTWWDAMEKCVDGYRESIRTTLQRQGHITEQGDSTPIPSASSQQSPKISRVNRVVSRGLAHRDARARSNSAASKFDTSETVWHLKNLVKISLLAIFCWLVYSRLDVNWSR